MLKTAVFICILFNVFILQVHSKTILENVTVSSDFIQNAFFDEIRFNSKLSGIDIGDIVNGQKCILQLAELAKTFPSYQSIQLLDAWGKIPSGLLSGHITDLGNYDQCIKTSVVLKSSQGITNGQYCFASFPLALSSNTFSGENSIRAWESKALATVINFKLGICIPDTCDSRLVTRIFQKAMSNVLNGKLSGGTVSNCSVAKKPDFRPLDIFAIVFFSTIGGLMLLSSLYDVATAYFGRKAVPLLLAFSVITNGRKLLTINTKSSPNSITCLTGIRVLSMFWVLHCHSFLMFLSLNITNILDAYTWTKNFWSLPILMGTLSVDSFFFLSGLLIAWLGFKELDKTGGKLNIALMYVHRYIRLTPALAAVIFFYVTLKNYIGSGPFREQYTKLSEGCEDVWWITLLYVQNYATSTLNCVSQSWYLAVDTQLYIISPLILIPLWKWGKKFIPVIVVLAVISIVWVAVTYFIEEYVGLLGFSNQLGVVSKIYTKTHGRYSVWLVGIGFGYFMHINRQKTIRLSVILQLIGWIVSFGTLLLIIFAPYFTTGSPYNSTVLAAALNESVKRVCWAIALAWIVFACHFGFGGLVNSILSHPLWQPLGRLTYCMYLVHMAVLEINYGSIRTDVYFSDYKMMLNFCSNAGITLLCAIALSLSFEAPILIIEKAIFGAGKRKPVDNEESLPAPAIQSKDI